MQKYCILAVEISSQLHGVALRIPHAYLCHLLSTSCKRILLVVCFASDPVQMPALRLDHTSCIEKKNSSFPLKKSTTKIFFSKRMLTYFVHRLKRHLGINFIGFRICLHKKYVWCAQLVKHTARAQNWHLPGCLEEPYRVV